MACIRYNKKKLKQHNLQPMTPRPVGMDLPPDAVGVPTDTMPTFWNGGRYAGVQIRSYETYPPRRMTAYRDDAVDTDTFLAVFPEFGNTEVFDRTLIEGCGKRAWFYCSKFAQCDQLDGDDRGYAWALMTAHLLVLTVRQRATVDNRESTISGLPTGVTMVGGKVSTVGQMGTTGMVSNASIGGESVGLTLPPFGQSMWHWWLSQTPYGVEYSIFMESHAPVGIYAEGDDFRLCLRD